MYEGFPNLDIFQSLGSCSIVSFLEVNENDTRNLTTCGLCTDTEGHPAGWRSLFLWPLLIASFKGVSLLNTRASDKGEGGSRVGLAVPYYSFIFMEDPFVCRTLQDPCSKKQLFQTQREIFSPSAFFAKKISKICKKGSPTITTSHHIDRINHFPHCNISLLVSYFTTTTTATTTTISLLLLLLQLQYIMVCLRHRDLPDQRTPQPLGGNQ